MCDSNFAISYILTKRPCPIYYMGGAYVNSEGICEDKKKSRGCEKLKCPYYREE